MTAKTLAQVMNQADDLSKKGAIAAAVDCYKHWLTSNQSEPHLRYVAFFNMGSLLRPFGQVDQAIAAFQEALQLKPDFYQGAVNLGLAYESKGDLTQALSTWNNALQYTEGQTILLSHLGRVYENIKNYDEAEKLLKRSLMLEPDQPGVLQHYLYIRQKKCQWPVLEPIAGLSTKALQSSCGPLGVLAITDEPAVQLQVASTWVERNIPKNLPRLSPINGYKHNKLRIGYMSCDFCWHAVSILTAELFELHDREQFEIYAIDFSVDDGGAMRQRVLAAMDYHLPIHTLTDEAAAKLISQHEIDILVDLTGLTAGARPTILAYKPAPIQISYLGLVGTCGIPEVDYILADRFVFPPELAEHFVEKPLYLPDVYQVSDSKREVGIIPTRESCGLPDDAFVYCSFNGSYKITSEVFSVWMKILQRVPKSVLWLVADNEWAKNNLKAEAEKRGVNPDRVIFAGKVQPIDYLARYRIADLMLDTVPYNAGTTANDALWMELLLLTCPGRTFASRMAGSLLNAMELPELIASSLLDYEEKAVALGNDPTWIAQLREKLRLHKLQSPLFNIPNLVRNIEQAYLSVRKRGTLANSKSILTSSQTVPSEPVDQTNHQNNPGFRMKIATLIPAYKIKYLPELLASLAAQTVQPDIVIVSDDSPDGIFRNALSSLEHKAVVSNLNLVIHEGPRKKSAFENFKNLIKLEGGQYDLVHVLLDDDVIYPDFYQRHLIAHNSGDFSCSISARWTAGENGQPYEDLPIPDYVRNNADRMLSLNAHLAFLTTVADSKNWFGEFSNVVFRSDCFSKLLDPRLENVSYAGLWDLGGFLHVSTIRPLCYIQDHLGYFRRGANDQNSAKPEYIKSAVIAYVALGIAAKKSGILSHEEVKTCFFNVASWLPVLQEGEPELSKLIDVMPKLIQETDNADEQFLEIWNKFLYQYGF